MADINVKFVSQKISKIRWRPSSNQPPQQSAVFATGSWDDETNKLTLWSLESDDVDQVYLDEMDSVAEKEPRLLCDVEHQGNVTDLKYMNMELLVASSSTGTVTICRHHLNTHTITVAKQWERLHRHGECCCPCTCLDHRDDMVVTGGEDGNIGVLNIESKHPIRIIEKADSCTVNSLTFLRQTEILTTNSVGQLKIFDLRQTSTEPVRTMSLSGEHLPLLCVDKHPSQRHIVATGALDGTLCLWDLRQDKFPVTLLEAHDSSLWEVRFHPNHPDHLFTCSENGAVWHWDASSVDAKSSGIASGSSLLTGTGAGAGGGNVSLSHLPLGGASGGISADNMSPWVVANVARHKLDIMALLDGLNLAVNSIDVERNVLVCGSDNESIFTITLPSLR